MNRRQARTAIVFLMQLVLLVLVVQIILSFRSAESSCWNRPTAYPYEPIGICVETRYNGETG